MCQLTEQVVFTESYIKVPTENYALTIQPNIQAANNRWTSPQLDADVAALHQDTELILAVGELKETFRSRAEALIHGDLHTGSVMVPCGGGGPGDRAGESRYRRYRKVFSLTKSFFLKFNAFYKY